MSDWRNTKRIECRECCRSWLRAACPSCSTDIPLERVALVERLILTEKRERLAIEALRERVQREEKHLAGQPDTAALMARIHELEQIAERQNHTIASLQRRTA